MNPGDTIVRAVDQLEDQIAAKDREIDQLRTLLAHSDTEPHQIRIGDYLTHPDGSRGVVGDIRLLQSHPQRRYIAWSTTHVSTPKVERNLYESLSKLTIPRGRRAV